MKNKEKPPYTLRSYHCNNCLKGGGCNIITDIALRYMPTLCPYNSNVEACWIKDTFELEFKKWSK